ncbi:MAG: hypothetical protein QM629_01785 [Parafilimonas sp.]
MKLLSESAFNIGPGAAIEITYPNGVRLNFSGDINAVAVKALVCCI